MNSLKPPRTVANVDANILMHVRAAVEAEFEPEDDWHDGGDDWLSGEANDSVLLTALQPITDLVLNDYGKSPFGLRYSVHLGGVKPGESQIGNNWHVDGQKNYGSYIVADKISTEFLVRARGLTGLTHGIQQRKYQHQVHKRFWDSEAIEPADMGMEIFVPDVLTLVFIKNHIHRSPLNTGPSFLARTFVRASLMPKRLPN